MHESVFQDFYYVLTLSCGKGIKCRQIPPLFSLRTHARRQSEDEQEEEEGDPHTWAKGDLTPTPTPSSGYLSNTLPPTEKLSLVVHRSAAKI